MTDIVERLRQGSLNKDDCRWKAADEIEKLREQLETAYMYGHDMAKAEYRHAIQEVEGENDRLRAALRPFAEAANGFDMQNVKNPEEWFAYGGIREGGQSPVGAITVGDLRRARTALQDKRDE